MLVTRGFRIDKTAAIALLAAALSGHAYAESNALTDTSGMTVYTFDKDRVGTSACYAQCSVAWPPVAAGRMPLGPDFTVIAREDGIRQAAYKGRPLYFFIGDRKVGDAAGDNVQNVWHVVVPIKPTAVRASHAPSAYNY